MRRLSKQPAELDLYRAPGYRDTAELLERQVNLLAREDRTLLTAYLQAGCSFHQLGRLTGMNRSSIARRIRRIIRRLSDPTYTTCLENRSRFSDQEMAVIRDYFVRGRPLSGICKDRKLCYYRARVIVEKARQVARSPDGVIEGGGWRPSQRRKPAGD